MLVYFIKQKHKNYNKRRDQIRRGETIAHKPTHDSIIYRQIFKIWPKFRSIFGVTAHCKLKWFSYWNQCIINQYTHSNLVTWEKLSNNELRDNELGNFAILNVKNTKSRCDKKIATSCQLSPNWTPAVNRQPGFRRG